MSDKSDEPSPRDNSFSTNSDESINTPTNNISMDWLLVNKQHYQRYLSQSDPKTGDEYKLFLTKLRKYKSKIVELTGQYLEKEGTHQINNDVDEAFSIYAKTLIQYFDMKELENRTHGLEKLDDDMMFENMDERTPSEEEVPVSSFWGKEKVIKKMPIDVFSSYPTNTMRRFKK